MKKLKEAGFTLIELLAVIVVLGIIALIVFPTVTRSLKGAKEKRYQQQIKMIESSARNWGIENTNSLSETKNSYLTLEALKKSGFIEATIIKDPRTNEEMKGCIVINYDKDYNQYFYEYTEKSCDEVGPVYLANEVKKKVITTGAGVYKISDTEYRYRGGCNLTTGSPYTCIDKDPINNYISISGQKYRIISVDNQGIKVITEKLLETKIPFDKGFVSTTSCTEETCPRNNANNTFCQVASGTYYGCGVYAAVNGNFTVGGKTGTVTQNSFMYDYLNTLGT